MNASVQFWAVFRTLLNVNLRVSYLRQMVVADRRRLPGTLLVAGAVAWSGYLMLGGYVKLLNTAFATVGPAGQAGAVLALALVGAEAMVMILGVYWVISSFYFSRDSLVLAALPVPDGILASARIAVLMLGEYATMALILVPAMAVWGIKSNAAAAYWISSMVVFLLSPVVPLAISAIAAMLIMAFVNVRRNRTLLMFIGTLLFFGAYFWFQYWAIRQVPGGEPDLAAMLMSSSDALTRMIGRRFPPAIWAAQALAHAGSPVGYRNLAATIGISAASAGIMIAVSSRLLRAGMASAASESRGRSQLESRLTDRLWVRRSPEAAIAIRDMWVLFRTPSFALNALANTLLLPGLLAVWFMAGGSGNPLNEIPGFDLITSSGEFEPIRAMVMAAMLTWQAGMNMVGASAFSREGAHFWVGRGLPLSTGKIVRGKVRFAMIFNAVAAIPMVAVMQFILRLSPPMFWLAMATAAAGTVWATLFGMAIDAFRPYLTWNHPQRAMKNSLNGIAATLAVTGAVAGMGWLIGRGLDMGMDGVMLLGLSGAVLVAMAMISACLLHAAAERTYSSIEQ